MLSTLMLPLYLLLGNINNNNNWKIKNVASQLDTLHLNGVTNNIQTCCGNADTAKLLNCLLLYRGAMFVLDEFD